MVIDTRTYTTNWCKQLIDHEDISQTGIIDTLDTINSVIKGDIVGRVALFKNMNYNKYVEFVRHMEIYFGSPQKHIETSYVQYNVQL